MYENCQALAKPHRDCQPLFGFYCMEAQSYLCQRDSLFLLSYLLPPEKNREVKPISQ